ncbi:MAG: hypothetical protein RR978_10355, partial [Oscillospiraceae bacterium]
YLNQMRINAAKLLYETGQFSTTEIIEKIGYKNPAHFYLHFKQCENKTYGEYKRKPDRGCCRYPQRPQKSKDEIDSRKGFQSRPFCCRINTET